jgi:MFS superfamily sulfate permease-like transporter
MPTNKSILSNLKTDLPAGIVVFLVALPLCLGIALASGAPFFSGMIAGIVGGLVVASISNSQLSVSGPAAGLAAIVLVSIQQLGSFNIFLLAVVLAGVIQVVLGFLKAGSISNYFPSNVIKGMLTAIGILIILKQIPHAFGYDADIEGNLDFVQANGENTFTALLHPLQHINAGAMLISVVALAILILWEKPFIKNKIGFIPGGLVAVIVSIAINEIFLQTNSSLAIIEKSHMVNVPIANSFNDFLGFFTFPDFTQITNVQVLTIAATIAIVASIETLLSIEAVDNIDPRKRITSTNLELKAQGIGNIVAGLIGGLPITSVIVRSSANVNAKAETKISAMFHGFLLLICVALIPTLLNKIPLAALAAILLTVGYKLTKISIYKEMFKNGKHQWIPFIVTVVVIVFTDLLKGVGVGLAVSIFFILKGNLKNAYFFHKEDYHEGDKINIQLAEEVSFLNKASIKQTLAHLPENSIVTIDASKTTYIDYDVLELVRNFKETQSKERNISVLFTGFKEVYNIENDTHVQSIHNSK